MSGQSSQQPRCRVGSKYKFTETIIVTHQGELRQHVGNRCEAVGDVELKRRVAGTRIHFII